MKILYYGACWPTNIGNAFIDYGSIHSIKSAMPRANVFFASELPRWLCRANRRDMEESIDLTELIEIDALVVSGMTICDEFIRVEGPVLSRLSRQGVRIFFFGCGGALYDQSEIKNFIKFLRGINVCGFISRDEKTYEYCSPSFPKSHNGIDCAFFLSDAFVPAKLKIKDFVVFNFDSMKEPLIETNRGIIRTHHSCLEAFPSNSISGKNYLPSRIRESLSFKPKKGIKFGQYGLRNTLISDIPEDYLNLYANTFATYSDRVHACIATLSFGHSARLYSDTPRALIFKRVGAIDIVNKLVKIDIDELNNEKKNQISFMREIF